MQASRYYLGAGSSPCQESSDGDATSEELHSSQSSLPEAVRQPANQLGPYETAADAQTSAFPEQPQDGSTSSQQPDFDAGASSFESSSSWRIPSVESVVRRVTALVFADRTSDPVILARTVARWNQLPERFVPMVEAMVLSSLAATHTYSGLVLDTMRSVAFIPDVVQAAHLVFGALYIDAVRHRMRNLDQLFEDMFPHLSALDYPIVID